MHQSKGPDYVRADEAAPSRPTGRRILPIVLLGVAVALGMFVARSVVGRDDRMATEGAVPGSQPMSRMTVPERGSFTGKTLVEALENVGHYEMETYRPGTDGPVLVARDSVRGRSWRSIRFDLGMEWMHDDGVTRARPIGGEGAAAVRVPALEPWHAAVGIMAHLGFSETTTGILPSGEMALMFDTPPYSNAVIVHPETRLPVRLEQRSTGAAASEVVRIVRFSYVGDAGDERDPSTPVAGEAQKPSLLEEQPARLQVIREVSAAGGRMLIHRLEPFQNGVIQICAYSEDEFLLAATASGIGDYGVADGARWGLVCDSHPDDHRLPKVRTTFLLVPPRVGSVPSQLNLEVRRQGAGAKTEAEVTLPPAKAPWPTNGLSRMAHLNLLVQMLDPVRLVEDEAEGDSRRACAQAELSLFAARTRKLPPANIQAY
jgi:hypothetical protein